MASCSSPASFIMLSLCTAASLPGRELSLSGSLPVEPDTHPHVWARSWGTLQPPFLSVSLSQPQHPKQPPQDEQD